MKIKAVYETGQGHKNALSTDRQLFLFIYEKRFPRLSDISPIGHFAHWTFRPLDISPIGHFARGLSPIGSWAKHPGTSFDDGVCLSLPSGACRAVTFPHEHFSHLSPMISSFSPTDKPCSSSSSSSTVPPCCSSSSSDEAEADTRGWPSVVNVLETPDRRRVRKTWRSVAIRVDLNRIPESVHHLPSVTNLQRSLPAIISRRQCPTFSPSLRKNGTKRLADTIAFSTGTPISSRQPGTPFTSPPLMRRVRHSPTLRTPKSCNNSSQCGHIHLSISPIGDCSPTSSSSSLPVLRPLNIHNYIGIRFSGEHLKDVTQSQLLNCYSRNGEDKATPPSSTTDENSFVARKRKEQVPSTSFESTKENSSTNDSGFLDSSDFEQPQHPHHLTHPPSSSSSFTIAAPAIPEQSYGPLEASVLDGILNDLSRWPSTDANSPGKTRTSPQRRSLLFERKLRALTIGQRKETPAGKLQRETLNTTRGIPSDLVVEMEEATKEVTWAELELLLPDLDKRSFQLMFGLSPDQHELTYMAHSFIRLQCPQSLPQWSLSENPTLIGHIRSIGLPTDCVTDRIVRLNCPFVTSLGPTHTFLPQAS
uniref:C2H2-type domain-containing protein n=1 Tax=Globodera rostochiensis TaxID=31243 RepID=A0A914GU28_GLORO